MRRTFYLAVSLLLFWGTAFGQSSGELPEHQADEQQVKKGEIPEVQQHRMPQGGSQGALRAPCDGDTILYEDFANGFNGNNDSAIAWDTSGTYQAWRSCNSACETNGSASDVGPLQSATAHNGYVNMDLQDPAGHIFHTSASNPPPGEPLGPAPEQTMTMSQSIDLSGAADPVISLETRFYHCCAIDHEILIEISTDGGNTWPESFDLAANYGRNEAPPNPATFTFELSDAISGNPSDVLIRFRWPDTGPDVNGQVSGIYNWYIDDVVIQEPNRNDLAATTKTVYAPDSSVLLNQADWPVYYTMIPRCNFNCLKFGGQICNVGANSVNDASLEVTVDEVSGAGQVYQETSPSVQLDSLSCVGVQDLADQIDSDTLWADPCFWDNDTGTYRAQFRSVLGDTADCNPDNDAAGTSREFRVTERIYALDHYERLQSVGNPIEYQGNLEVNNVFEFSWMDPSVDTVKQVCFYVDSASTPGTGPITAGITDINRDTQVAYSSNYYVEQEDLGEIVCLNLVRNDEGAFDKIGQPVPVPGTNSTMTAFVEHEGSQNFAVGTSGGVPGSPNVHTLLEDGDGSFFTTNAAIIRLRMNRREEQSCQPEPDIIRSVSEHEAPASFSLAQNRPNPFTDQSAIRYELQEGAKVRFSVRDVTGKVVKEESYGRQSRGEHRVDLNGSDFEAGIYYYTLQVGGERSTKKMIITE